MLAGWLLRCKWEGNIILVGVSVLLSLIRAMTWSNITKSGWDAAGVEDLTPTSV